MKTISEYLDEAIIEESKANWLIFDVDGNRTKEPRVVDHDISYQKIYDMAMQSRKQDHDIEMEYLKTKLKSITLATDKQKWRVNKEKEIHPEWFINYVEKYGAIDFDKITMSEASFIIDSLEKLKIKGGEANEAK